MVQSVGLNNSYINNMQFRTPAVSDNAQIFNSPYDINKLQKVHAVNVVNGINTVLSNEDKNKYLYLVNFLKNSKPSVNSDSLLPTQQLDLLLKNGKLLSTASNDKSTTLDNLYEMVTTDRICNLNKEQLLKDTLDILVNPRYVTQNFGNIPSNYKQKILSILDDNDPAKINPSSMDISASGVCPAASIEVNAADKYPAEYARWINKLSSKNDKLTIRTSNDTICSTNTLEAIDIINAFEIKRTGSFSFTNKKGVANNSAPTKANPPLNLTSNEYIIAPDKNAYIRAQVQQNDFDYGERNVADVLFQSAVMQTGTQNTYNSLTDEGNSKFSNNAQGLIELEKTFVESLIKNKEITSLIYQKIDNDCNLVGYNCSFDKIEKHIIDTINSGDDVIIGYVLTNETANRTKDPNYDPKLDGSAQKVINGHEITIVDYKKDENGKTKFICVDTDDDDPGFVEYSADWLLPKIHHAGYPAYIVKDDVDEIMRSAQTAY